MAKSVKDRLLNIARKEGRAFDVLLVRFALERLLYRLSVSAHRDRFILTGGMLVKALRQHGPMRPEGAWTLAAYDAAKMTARAHAS